MNTQIKRRNFLQRAASLTTGLLVLSETSLNAKSGETFDETQIPLLNPAFRVNTFNNGDLEIYTFLADKSRLSESFSGLEADIMVEITRHENPLTNIEILASNHKMEVSLCRQKTREFLEGLYNSRIIYYGEIMKVKIHEI